jgi:23S rRNA A1618 N6-methylase RlmF
VGRVHRPSTLSLPAVSLPIGGLLPPVCHVPLLASFMLIWKLDIDSVSLVSAQANIDRNSLSDRITLLRADSTGPILLPLLKDTTTSCVTHSKKSYPGLIVEHRFDFSLCNPPFYASTEEATQSAAAKELLPNAVRSPIPTIFKRHLEILYSR